MHEGITQTRFDEEQVSIEAKVSEAILNSEGLVETGKLGIRTVTEQFNLGLPENEQVTVWFISRRVSALGFEKCRLTGGLTGYNWDADVVERLSARADTRPPPKMLHCLHSLHFPRKTQSRPVKRVKISFPTVKTVATMKTTSLVKRVNRVKRVKVFWEHTVSQKIPKFSKYNPLSV